MGSLRKMQDDTRASILRAPDNYCVYLDGKVIKKRPGDSPRDIFVRFEEDADTGSLSVVLHATKADLYHLRLRWNFHPDELLSAENGFSSVRVYSEHGRDGDCGFHGIEPDRLMPWFFAAASGSDMSDDNIGRTSVCYGVTSSAAAHCAWQLDHLGVTLWIDMRSGRMPLMLKGRGIRAAAIKRTYLRDMSAFEAAKAFCAELFEARPLRERILGTRLPLNRPEGTFENLQNKVTNNALLLETVSVLIDKPVYMILDDRCDIPDTELHKLADSISRHGVLPAILYHPFGDENIRLIKAGSAKSMPDISDPKVVGAICRKIRSIIRMGFRMIALDYDDFDIFGHCDSFAETMHLPDDDEKLIYRHHTSAEIINSLYFAIRSAIASEEEIFGFKIPLFIFGAVPHLCSAADYMTVMPSNGTHQFIKTLHKSVTSLIPALIKDGYAGGYAAYLSPTVSSSARKASHNVLTHLSKCGLSFIMAYDAEISSGTQSHDFKEYFTNATKPPENVYPIDLTENSLPVIWRRGRKSVILKLFGRDGYEHFGNWKI